MNYIIDWANLCDIIRARRALAARSSTLPSACAFLGLGISLETPDHPESLILDNARSFFSFGKESALRGESHYYRKEYR